MIVSLSFAASFQDMVPERKWPADKLAGKISKINNPTDVNAKMILFNSALNVFMAQTSDLNNFNQDYFRETVNNFLADRQLFGHLNPLV